MTPPGSVGIPRHASCQQEVLVCATLSGGKLTSFDVFFQRLRLSASHGRVSALRLELVAAVAEAAVVHGPLQSIALPSEDVVTVLAITSATIY